MTMGQVPTELVLAHCKRIMFRLQVILWIVWAFILLSGLFFTLTIALVLTHPRGDAPPPPDARQIMVLFVVAGSGGGCGDRGDTIDSVVYSASRGE